MDFNNDLPEFSWFDDYYLEPVDISIRVSANFNEFKEIYLEEVNEDE